MTRLSLAALGSFVCLALVACGPSTQRNNQGGDGGSDQTCTPGATQACYDGQAGTEGVGPCKGGTQTCSTSGFWSQCTGEVIPVGEVCGDHIDNNCNGMVDEDVDADGDGWTTCGGDCCDSTECSNPSQVNPGAYDVPGDGVDNDCDGMIDNAIASCDQGLSGQSTMGMDYAKAIDLCQTTTMADPLRHWGVIDAKFSRTDGANLPDAQQHAILARYGTGVTPHGGSTLALFSTGVAAGMGDPGFTDTLDTSFGNTAKFPADFYAANGSKLPNAPGCPAPLTVLQQAGDPIMLTMHIRVPTNASSFSLDVNFFSDEYPEYTCTQFNDFFVVLLDSTYSGTPANPTDKNLAFYTDSQMKKYPVGVNLASGNTGLFTQCVNGHINCPGGGPGSGSITTCTSTAELAGTGMDKPEAGACDSNSLMGGGTGWLTTSGNVKPGEIMTLRIAIWDTSDTALDSLAVLDNFKWSAQPSTPGTVIQ